MCQGLDYDKCEDSNYSPNVTGCLYTRVCTPVIFCVLCIVFKKDFRSCIHIGVYS